MFENERKKLFDIVKFEEPVIEEKAIDDRHSRFTVQPLLRGYGLTVGNALRRVLLSSMPGSAVVCVKIEGAVHEFSTLPDVKEDVCEIIQNIKCIRANLFSETTKHAYINLQGPCDVTAGDIESDSELVIINPEQHLLTVGENGSIHMELIFDRGIGYLSSGQNKAKYNSDDVSLIYTDSIFTPVKKVEYAVEPARVGGNMENDRLLLDVFTDGTITPCEAVTLASKILIGHFSLFTKYSADEPEEDVFKNTSTDDKDAELNRTVEELDLSVRSFNCLKRANINTVRQLIEMTEFEISHIRNLGVKSCDEIRDKLVEMGLHFREENE